VLELVTRVLEEADGPLRARDIHAAVSELHGVPVRRASVRQALSAYTTGADRRFRRTGHGLYEFVAD
jgi:Fe2+ or Zn2+ uptake regulation protein